jgi:hypothetical protein
LGEGYNPNMSEQKAARNQGAISDDGVDVTLIRWMLSLTPAERLQILESNTRSLEKLLGAADRR